MKRIVGAFEKVDFPDFGLFEVIAKVDTGATSGSLHATHIKEILLPTNDTALSFRPYGREPRVLLSEFTQKEVTSSNGITELRYVIPTTIVIRGVQYPILINLANRTKMKKGALIGRKFLRQHGFLVDSKKGTKYRSEVK